MYLPSATKRVADVKSVLWHKKAKPNEVTLRAGYRRSGDPEYVGGKTSLAGHRVRSDSGAVMILALVYFISMSLIIAALARESTNDLSNTSKFTYAFALQNAAGSATEVAINFDRYASQPLITPVPITGTSNNPAISCLGPSATPSSLTFDNGPTSDPTQFVNTISVWCSTVWDPSSSDTRVVTFCAYPSGISGSAGSASTCVAGAILKAVVTFDDYPSSLAASIDAQCNVWCGTGESVSTWDWLL
jgi:hypothetical protein